MFGGDAARAQSTPASTIRDIVLRDAGRTDSDPAAAYFNREELAIVVTRHAWNLELAGPAGARYVVIEPGHDSNVNCSDLSLQTHLRVAGTPTGTATQIWAGAFEFESVAASSGFFHETTTWTDALQDPPPQFASEFGGTVSLSVTPIGESLDWSALGSGQGFRAGAARDDDSIAGADFTYTTPSSYVVNYGVYGAHIYTFVESGGHRTEVLTATIEVFGMKDAGGTAANAILPSATAPLGCCELDCGVVVDITEADCDRIEGSEFTPEGSCTLSPSNTYCGGGVLSDPTVRDDIIYVDGEVHPFDQYCAGGDEPGGGSPTYVYNGLEAVAPAPIEQTTGRKIETATDLSVQLSGSNFNLTRRYRSVADSSNTLLGNAWDMGLFSFIDVDTSGSNPVLILKAPQGFAQFNETDPGVSGVWTTGGPSSQTMTKEVSEAVDGYPVWRLTQPGGWQIDFHRLPDSGESNLAGVLPSSDLEGLPYRKIDLAGNRWSFSYDLRNGAPRLRSITCERHTTGGEYDAEAVISLFWHGSNAPDNAGRLRSVIVTRPDGSDWEISHIVEYSYYEDLLQLGHTDISHLGSAGDLVQVIVSERLDDHGSAEVYRERITQYRYHIDGTTETDDPNISEASDQNGNGIRGERGANHQLKMVINPFEIEYFAEYHRKGSTAFNLRDAALELMLLGDGDTAFTVDALDGSGTPGMTTVVVSRLASKVIARYDGDKVQVQYLQASCGCGGSMQGQLGVRREYEYWQDTISGTIHYTFTVTEQADFNGTQEFSDYRVYRTHHQAPASGGVPRLVIESLTDSNNTSMQWVKGYIYSARGELKAVVNPSAIADYESADTPNGEGMFVASGSDGLVMGYEYDATYPGRVTKIYSRKGYNASFASGWDLIEAIERTNGTRPDLITKRIRYRVAGSASADDQEVTTYSYKFWTPDGTTAIAGQLDEPIIAYRKVSVERELTGENGPGTGTYDTQTIFDVNGRMVLQLAADGSLTEYEYAGDTSLLAKVTRNRGATHTWTAPSSKFTVSGGLPSLSGRTDGGSMITEYERDFMGRVTSVISPGGIRSWTYRTMQVPPSRTNDELLYYSEITLPHIMNSGGTAFNGTATQTWLDASNITAEVQSFVMPTVTATGEAYRVAALDHIDGLTPATRAAMNIDWASKSIEQRIWHDASEANAYYTTRAQFDEFGRSLWQKDAEGTFTEYTYDVKDRVTSVSVGTSRTGTSNMVVVSNYYYDGDYGMDSSGVGDGNLTLQRQNDGTTNRDTITTYDHRNRPVFVENPLPPHSYTVYDNLNRPIEQHQVSEITNTEINSLEQTDLTKRIRSGYTSYSQRGLVYENGIEIDPTDASDTDLLVNKTWFDEVGRAIKVQPAGGAATKTAFDGLGRVTHRFTGEMLGDSGYSEVYDLTNHRPVLTGDVVLSESVTRYIIDGATRGFGQPDLMTIYKRAHNSSSTGSLSGFAGTSADTTAIATYTMSLYDEASRPVKSGYYGTNDSSGYVAGGTAPSVPSNDFSLSTTVASLPAGALASETIYDDQGRAHVSIGPDGTRTRSVFDDMDRTIATIENDQDGVALSWSTGNGRWAISGASTNVDEDRVTSFVYDGNSNLIKRTAHVDGSAVQETIYDYDYSGSAISSKSLLASVRYPNETTGEASTASAYTVSYEYNRLGEMTEMTDQNSTVHAYTYDALGRMTLDAVTSFGTSIDQTIQAIEYAYSPTTGLIERVSSLDGTDLGRVNILNEIRYEYDDMLALTKYRQNPTGAVGSGHSADVEYVYTRETANAAGSGTKNFSRLAELRYPLINSGGKQRTILTQFYGAGGSLDDKISRSRGFNWEYQSASAVDHAIRYDHLGMGNPVLVDYEDEGLQLNRYIDPTYNGSGATTGEYAGMDQYGRLTRQVWAASSWDPDLAPAVIDVAYHYDVNSDITQRYDARQGTSLADQGDEYAYDGLHRLTGASRGKPVSGWTADGTRAEDWDLDVFGNWNSYDNSIGSDLVEETRDHNQANELIENSRSINSGTAVDLDSTYDDAGNLRTRMVDAEVRWVYTWDAWNRLVAVDIEQDKDGWAPLAPRLQSSYYGLNQRAWSRLDAGAAGYTNNGVPTNVLDRMELFYYDASWRLLERRTDESWNGTSFVHDSTSQWVWGQRYIDELVASITDGDVNDEFEDLFYAMTDRNFSVIGLSQSAGSSGERIRYDAYGQAQAMPLGDADHNGAVDLDDQNILLVNFGAEIGDTGSPLYRVEADFNSDGAIDLDDFDDVLTNFGDSIERGRLSGSGNIVGYAGYIFEPATGMYVVRNRWYSTENGKWLSRDPFQYVDGQNQYEYVASRSLRQSDPRGLCAANDADCNGTRYNPATQCCEGAKTKTIIITRRDQVEPGDKRIFDGEYVWVRTVNTGGIVEDKVPVWRCKAPLDYVDIPDVARDAWINTCVGWRTSGGFGLSYFGWDPNHAMICLDGPWQNCISVDGHSNKVVRQHMKTVLNQHGNCDKSMTCPSIKKSLEESVGDDWEWGPIFNNCHQWSYMWYQRFQT